MSRRIGERERESKRREREGALDDVEERVVDCLVTLLLALWKGEIVVAASICSLL